MHSGRFHPIRYARRVAYSMRRILAQSHDLVDQHGRFLHFIGPGVGGVTVVPIRANDNLVFDIAFVDHLLVPHDNTDSHKRV